GILGGILVLAQSNRAAQGERPLKETGPVDLTITLTCSVAAIATEQQARAERTYVGFKECVRCHNSGIEGEIELPGGGKLSLMKEQWVLYKEYPIWAKEDKHGQAYTVLLNERSKQIGKALGVSEIHRDRRCLACHTGFPISQMPLDKDHLVDRELPKSLDVNLGVSCEGCHG